MFIVGFGKKYFNLQTVGYMFLLSLFELSKKMFWTRNQYSYTTNPSVNNERSLIKRNSCSKGFKFTNHQVW